MQRRLFLARSAQALGFVLWPALALPPDARAETAATKPPLELASSWAADDSPAGWWVSEKYDGVRAYWDGRALFTRGGYRIALPPWFTAGWPQVPLDGELWAGRGRFAQIQTLVARHGGDANDWRGVRFMVFDLPAHGGDFDARLQALQALLGSTTSQWLEEVPQRRVGSAAELQALLRETLAAGGEGLMLRRGDAPYRAGRSPHLRKLKAHDDAEAQVVAHIPGRGRHEGRLGALLVQTPEGLRFRIGTGFTDAQRENPPPVGSWVTYRYRGLHPGSGLPRFASFLRVHTPDAP